MKWNLMFIIAENSAEQEEWYVNEDETLYRIVFSDGSETITDDYGRYDD